MNRLDNNSSSNTSDFEQESGFNLAETLRELFLPYWPMFLVSIVLAISLGYVYLKFTHPIYQVNAKILIKDNKKLGASANDELLEQLDLFSGSKVLENEMEIIKSRLILADVSQKLSNRVKWFRERRTIDVLMDFDFPVKLVPQFDEPFQGTNPLMVTFDVPNKTMFMDGQAIPLEDSSYISLGNRQTFLMRVDLPRLEKWKKNTFYVHVQNREHAINEIAATLNVSANNKQNTIIDLAVTSNNNQIALATLNQVIHSYKDASIGDKQLLATNTLNFIEERLYLLTMQLDSVEKDVEIFKTKNHIVNLSEQSRLFLESVKAQDQRLSEIGVQLSVLDELDQYLKGKGNNPGTVPSLINFEDPILSNLLNKLYEQELQLQRSRRSLGQKDQTILALEDDIASMKVSILENTSNLRNNLRAQQADLNANLQEKLR
ncbi:MAG: GumC family protein, partial [Flavobacteriales bacterium]